MSLPVPGSGRHPRDADRRGDEARGELSLLDADALRSGDPQGLVPSYLRFGDQLRRSYEAAAGASIDAGSARAVVFCGMGGSAAAGDVAAAAYEDDAPVSMSVRRGYRLPAWVGRDTLVMALSYSGDTEETLAAFDEASGRGARTVAVSAGGALAARASEAGGVHVAMPADAPQPRAALGSLAGAAIGALVAAGVLEDRRAEVDATAETLRRTAERLAADAPADENRAAVVADWLGDRVPVIWGSEGVSSAAAWRWKCAFNENAKIPAFASALPELDHHEVAGWTKGQGDAFGVVVLREPGEHPSVQPRLDATLEELRAADVEVIEVSSEGESALARTMSLMMIGDVASAYHAVSRGVDPAPIEAIARVKRRLSG